VAKFSVFAIILGLLGITAPARAELDPVSDRVRVEIAKTYPEARVELTSQIHWDAIQAPESINSVSVLSESAKGEVQFLARTDADEITASSTSKGRVTFSAWVPAQIALRRVTPGEKLSADLFVFQDVNVAQGPHREYRGVILGKQIDVAHLEARQTILEGQMLLSNAVRRVPDVRRGDVVRIEINSNGIVLSTQGTAQEPAYLNSQLRVMTQKSKRELVGKLHSNGVVEVRL
jgi:flagella basal body P-ring formation protein FlgA